MKRPTTNLLPVRYVQEVWLELKKVDWPTKEQTLQKTIIVVIASVIVGAYVAGLDVLFAQLLSLLLENF